MKKLLSNKWIIVLIIFFIIGIIMLVYQYFVNNKLLDTVQDNDIEIISNNECKTQDVSDLNKTIYVHIIGEVRNEGVVEINEGERIKDAIEKAGGVKETADVSKVNLAYVLSDGDKIRIPSVYDEANEEYLSNGGGSDVIIESKNMLNNNSKININSASQTELETLNGVGPSLAAKIIEYREKNGKFKAIEELKNVNGIGEAKFEILKEQIEIK